MEQKDGMKNVPLAGVSESLLTEAFFKLKTVYLAAPN